MVYCLPFPSAFTAIFSSLFSESVVGFAVIRLLFVSIRMFFGL